MSTRTIAGITVPDTPTIAAAQALARDNMEEWAYNHVIRSWLLGFAVCDRVPGLESRDRELHSVAAILHDLGWIKNSTFSSSDKCFEVDGANAARRFIENQPTVAQWDVHRQQLLWDAIALHTYAPVAQHKEPEVRATQIGIATDFTGPAGVPGGALLDSEWKAISQAFPRDDFRTNIVEVLCGFCRTKPDTTYLNFVGDFGEELVEGYTRKGHRGFDLISNTVDSN